MRVKKFFTLPANERNLLLAAGLLLVASKVALYVLPFTTIRRILERVAPRTPREDSAKDQAAQINWAIQKAALVIPGARCLPKATAAVVLLARLGYPAKLHVGVAKGIEGRLLAHSWVECQGQVVTGGFDGLSRYVRLPL